MQFGHQMTRAIRFLMILALIAILSVPASAQPDEALKKFNEAVQAKQSADAIAAYEEAIKLAGGEDYLQARINVGALYYEKGDYKKAAEHLNKAVALDSSNTDALKSLGQIQLKAEEFKSAIVSFERYLSVEPKDDAVWLLLAEAYKGLDDDAKRLNALKKAADANPQNKTALYNIGNIYQTSEDFSQAMSSYKKAIAADPKYVEAYYNLAIASQQYDFEQCVSDWEAFIKAAGTQKRWKSQVAQAKDIIKQIKEYLDVKE